MCWCGMIDTLAASFRENFEEKYNNLQCIMFTLFRNPDHPFSLSSYNSPAINRHRQILK